MGKCNVMGSFEIVYFCVRVFYLHECLHHKGGGQKRVKLELQAVVSSRGSVGNQTWALPLQEQQVLFLAELSLRPHTRSS